MFVKVFSTLALAGAAMAQTFSLSSPPSIQQCQPVALTITGGSGPFILSAIPAGQVSAAPLANIDDNVTGNSYTWTPQLSAGTAITLRAVDSGGNIAYSDPKTILEGSTSCVNGAASGASSAASGSSSVAVGAGAASSVSASTSISTSASTSGTVVSVSASASSSVSVMSGATGAGAMSMSSMTGGSMSSMNSASRSPAASSPSGAAASVTSAAAGYMSASPLNVPVLAFAAAVGAVAFGGFATLA